MLVNKPPEIEDSITGAQYMAHLHDIIVYMSASVFTNGLPLVFVKEREFSHNPMFFWINHDPYLELSINL